MYLASLERVYTQSNANHPQARGRCYTSTSPKLPCEATSACNQHSDGCKVIFLGGGEADGIQRRSLKPLFSFTITRSSQAASITTEAQSQPLPPSPRSGASPPRSWKPCSWAAMPTLHSRSSKQAQPPASLYCWTCGPLTRCAPRIDGMCWWVSDDVLHAS